MKTIRLCPRLRGLTPIEATTAAATAAIPMAVAVPSFDQAPGLGCPGAAGVPG